MHTKNPTSNLERLFHEPNRLAMLSALASSGEEGLSFGELRTVCGLTDGNLSRHLTALEEEGIVCVEKTFVDRKPRTTITPTRKGLDRFAAYLATLERVLVDARASLPARHRAQITALRRATA
ncbi:MAG: transcriptional regulator [Kiritimatiellaeota bacterium]|nr:transcriptional regulator [Kiritimatiellota bacterium]